MSNTYLCHYCNGETDTPVVAGIDPTFFYCSEQCVRASEKARKPLPFADRPYHSCTECRDVFNNDPIRYRELLFCSPLCQAKYSKKNNTSADEMIQGIIDGLREENEKLKTSLTVSGGTGEILKAKMETLERELKIRDSRVKLWERKFKKAEKELKKLKKAQEEENWEYNIP